MSTGYGWEGTKQVCATLLGARHVPISASVVAVYTWGAITSARPLPFLPLCGLLVTERGTKNGECDGWDCYGVLGRRRCVLGFSLESPYASATDVSLQL